MMTTKERHKAFVEEMRSNLVRFHEKYNKFPWRYTSPIEDETDDDPVKAPEGNPGHMRNRGVHTAQ